ncbi:MAG: hypothetical protein GY708_28135 [Actinomycetia bacterium]|nr:hypothetical protein [Actinomycetes bacterium]MCP4959418.1 hypothetical protein [Actinomycetes bacterium]
MRARLAVSAFLMVLAACSTGSTGSSGRVTTSLSVVTEPVVSIPQTTASGLPAVPISDRLGEGALLGISTGLTQRERESRWPFLEELAGRQYDIAHVFHSWDKAIPTPDDLMLLEGGRILMISWNGTDTIEIWNGRHDEWIRTQARAVRDLGEPVLMRWLWEMDGQRRREWVHSGADYVAAWNHIRGLFDEEGATNAEFVWCPNEALFWNGGDPMPWYPGDDRVDWLCADGYNWATTTTSPDWIGLEPIFADFYDWAVPRGLPIIVGETGVAEAEPGAKADWILSIPATLRTRFPEIDAFVYFDKDFRTLGGPDWRLDTSGDALEAWVTISQDPWFN